MCDSMMERLTRIIADAINEALEDCRGTVARFARDLDAAKADADSARSSAAADRRALEDREAEVIALRGRYERAMRERDEAREWVAQDRGAVAGVEQDVIAQHERAEALGELLREERRLNIELRRELEQLRECVEPVDEAAPHDNLIDALQRGRQIDDALQRGREAAVPVVDQFQFRGVRVDDERIEAAEAEIAELRESEAALRSYSVALMTSWTEQHAELRRLQDRINDEGKRIDSARTMGPAGTPDEVDASADRGDAGGVGPVPG